jgi:S1-C subfamily serine protease
MPGELWYVRKLGRVTGPFNLTQLEGLRRRSQLATFHEVSQDKRTWVSAASLDTLFGSPGGNGSTADEVPLQDAAPPPPTADEWFYNDGQKPAGPVDSRHFAALIQSGQIRPETQVWKRGAPNWVALREVPEFAHLIPGSKNGAGTWTNPPDATTSEAPAEDDAKAMRRWSFLVLGAGACVLALALVASLVVLRIRNKGEAGIVGSRKEANKPIAQAKIIDNYQSSGIPEAVGLVVCGWTVTWKSGGVWDDIDSTGSCFAVNAKGHLLTNKHVIEDTQKRQRMPQDFLKKDYAHSSIALIIGKGERTRILDEEKAGKVKLPPPDDPKQREETIQRMIRETAEKVVDNIVKSEVVADDVLKISRMKVFIEPKVWVFFGKEKYEAKILYTSDRFDLGVMRVERAGMPYFHLVTDDESKFSQAVPVYALGFPAATRRANFSDEDSSQQQFLGRHDSVENQLPDVAFHFSISAGIVNLVRIDEKDKGSSKIQHSAKISGGNSGGPLIDENGDVVGINTWVNQEISSSGVLVQDYYALTLPQTLKELERYVPEMSRK